MRANRPPATCILGIALVPQAVIYIYVRYISLCEKHKRVVSLQRTWIGGDVICAGEATAKAPVLSMLIPQAVRCTTLSVPPGYNSGMYNFQPNVGKGPSVRDRYCGYMGLDLPTTATNGGRGTSNLEQTGMHTKVKSESLQKTGCTQK